MSLHGETRGGRLHSVGLFEPPVSPVARTVTSRGPHGSGKIQLVRSSASPLGRVEPLVAFAKSRAPSVLRPCPPTLPARSPPRRLHRCRPRRRRPNRGLRSARLQERLQRRDVTASDSIGAVITAHPRGRSGPAPGCAGPNADPRGSPRPQPHQHHKIQRHEDDVEHAVGGVEAQRTSPRPPRDACTTTMCCSDETTHAAPSGTGTPTDPAGWTCVLAQSVTGGSADPARRQPGR